MTNLERHFVEEYDGGCEERGRTWSLVDSHSGSPAWSVNRRDIGAREHVLRAEQHSEILPAHSALMVRTRVFVQRLLEQIGLIDDPVGWVADNLTAMLTLASGSIDAWSGNEWAVDFEPNVWLPSESPRRVHDFVCARGSIGQAFFSSYQDLEFGLGCEYGEPPPLLNSGEEMNSGRRANHEIAAVTGSVRAVEVLFESHVPGMEHRALPVEAVIHGWTGASTLIVSGDQYLSWDGSVTFSRFDTDVILVPNARDADSLDWGPVRPHWVRWDHDER